MGNLVDDVPPTARLSSARQTGPAGRRIVGWEFGPAELLDLLLIRPLAMYAGARLLGNFVTGVLAGKVAADAVFYTIAIISYEAANG